MPSTKGRKIILPGWSMIFWSKALLENVDANFLFVR